MAYKRRLRFDKRIRFRKSMSIMYILLFAVLASLGVGYAYIKSNLNINGTANVVKANWDVHFENLQVTTGSVTASSPASITDDTTVEFGVTLDEPNDFYEFTVDVANEGTMDAMIDSFSITPTLTTAQKKYLEYTITYSSGGLLVDKQKLAAGDEETIKVKFRYKENYDTGNYPTEDQSFNISFTTNYTQADGTEIEIEHSRIIYTANLFYTSGPDQIQEDKVYLGQELSDWVIPYNSQEEAIAAYVNATGSQNYPYCLKHKLENGIVTESYVIFVITPYIANLNSYMTAGTYTLRGGVDESALSSKPIFEANKATLISAYTSSHCTINSSSIYCSMGQNASTSGAVYAGDSAWSCGIAADGSSGCAYID